MNYRMLGIAESALLYLFDILLWVNKNAES
jgi:hypothetical protein